MSKQTKHGNKQSNVNLVFEKVSFFPYEQE